MKVCALMEYLQKLPQEAEIDISIDVSLDDDDLGERAFSNEFLEHVEHSGDITLLFSGYLNTR